MLEKYIILKDGEIAEGKDHPQIFGQFSHMRSDEERTRRIVEALAKEFPHVLFAVYELQEYYEPQPSVRKLSTSKKGS